MKDTTELSIHGFLKIHDPKSNHVFFDGNNAIHYENFSLALAKSLINSDHGFIDQMVFGNGGTAVDPTGIITYLTPNSFGLNAGLYNQTYNKVINDQSSYNADPTRNYLETRHVNGTYYTDIFITCLLDYGEPADQSAFDNTNNNSEYYVFDELGLKSYSPTGNNLLLTHVIFHPIQKSLNRLIQIDYTVRIQTLTGSMA